MKQLPHRSYSTPPSARHACLRYSLTSAESKDFEAFNFETHTDPINCKNRKINRKETFTKGCSLKVRNGGQ